MTKLKDVAEKANVSLATASLALSNSTLVNVKTKEKVRNWAEKMGYYPNINAQRLARQKSYNICLMLNAKDFFKSSNIYYLRVIGGIIKEAERTEYSITFTFYGDNNNEFPLKTIGSGISIKNFDGIIIFDVIEKDILDLLKHKAGMPVVLVDNHCNYPEIYAVDNDDFGGAYKATRYLIELGHKEIGMVSVPEMHPLGRECLAGFRKALQESGLKEYLVYKDCDLGISSGRKAAEDLLISKIKLPTAFFCVNDFIAIGLIEQFKRKGFSIPEDFSIIGMDDMDISSEIEPPLTTVKIEMEALGQQGIKKLIDIINNNYDGEIKTILKNKIIERESCSRI
jgi:DNA-binding LacI/PurR family transcriptional regulator